MKEDEMSEKYKKALRLAAVMGCGFEGDAEDAAELLTLITGLESRIAELREDNASLGDSNAWLKQNYEDLERDYGVMYDKMCARIDQLTAHSDIERQDDKCSKPEPNVCEACGGDGTVVLRDGYRGQLIVAVKCIYCNGIGRVNKERER